MIGNAFAAAYKANAITMKLDAEKRRKSQRKGSKSRKQGWFKPGSEKLENVPEKRAHSNHSMPMKPPPEPQRKDSISTETTELTTPLTPRCVSGGSNRSLSLMCTPNSLTDTPQRSVTSKRSVRSLLMTPSSVSSSASSRGHCSGIPRAPMDDSSEGSSRRRSSASASRAAPVRSSKHACTPMEDNSDQPVRRRSSCSAPRRAGSVGSVRSCVPSAPIMEDSSDRSCGTRGRGSMSRTASVRSCVPSYSVADDSTTASSPDGMSRASEQSPVSASPSTACDNPIIDALIGALDDDRMSDVTLIGRDGARVRATKYVLACQSKALQKVLYCDPTAAEVHLGPYGEPAIRALKDFSCTGALTLSFGHKNAAAARGLAELASLAQRFQLTPLYEAAKKSLIQVLEEAPWFATASYDAAIDVPELKAHVVEVIAAHSPDMFLQTDSLKHLSHRRLGDLMSDLVNDSDNHKLFYIQKWVDIKGFTESNVAHAKAIASQALNLEELLQDPTWVHVIRSCGFFDLDEVDRIVEAMLMEEESSLGDGDDDDSLDVYTASVESPMQRSDATLCMQLTMGGEVMVISTEDADLEEDCLTP